MTDTRRISKRNNKSEDPAVDGDRMCWLLLVGLSQCEGLMFMLGTFLFVCALYQATHTKEDPASNRTNSQTTEGTFPGQSLHLNHNNYDEDDEEEESDDDSASADPMLCLD